MFWFKLKKRDIQYTGSRICMVIVVSNLFLYFTFKYLSWLFPRSQCQAQLPATGVPVTRQRADQMKEMFQEYVKNRTLSNWKFWIVSFLNYIIHIIHSHSTTVIQMIHCSNFLIIEQAFSLTNLKFSTIIQGLFDTYNNMVSTASIDELCRTTLAWLDQHCSLVVLRPGKFIQHVRCTW